MEHEFLVVVPSKSLQNRRRDLYTKGVRIDRATDGAGVGGDAGIYQYGGMADLRVLDTNEVVEKAQELQKKTEVKRDIYGGNGAIAALANFVWGGSRQRDTVESTTTYGHVDEDAIETDYKLIEVKSTRYHRESIESIIAQVKAAEKIVVDAARKKIDPDARIFAYSGFADLREKRPLLASPTGGAERAREVVVGGGREDEEISVLTPTYAGSYHVWITLPHGANWMDPEERNRLARTHAILAHRLQWMEPLLLCLMSGDPRAVGSGLQYPRASMRSTLNAYSGYGTTDPKSLLHLEWKHLSKERRRVLNSRVRYYPSADHLRYAFGDDRVEVTDLPMAWDGNTGVSSRKGPAYSTLTPLEKLERKKRMVRKLVGNQTVALWVNMVEKDKNTGEVKTTRRPLELCTDVTRADWGNPGDEEGANTFQQETRLPRRDARLPYQDLLYEKGSFYDMGRGGNDIRVVGCGKSLSYPLQVGWNKAWVFDGVRRNSQGEQEIQLLLHFFRAKIGTVDNQPKKKVRKIVVRSFAPLKEEAGEASRDHLDNTKNDGGEETKRKDKAKDEEAAQRKVVGFEFRMMDNFSSSLMLEILRLITLLSASAVRCERTRVPTTLEAIRLLEEERALHSPAWNAALVRVSQRGSRTKLPRSYIEQLNIVLFGDEDKMEIEIGERRAYHVLLDICSRLHDKFRNHKVTLCMQDRSYADPPRPMDHNFFAWKRAFLLQMGKGKVEADMSDEQIVRFLETKKRDGDKDWEPDLAYLDALR